MEHGEIVAILGPNGAGKSTLVKQMVGHLRPTSGTITLMGWDVVRHPDSVPMVVAYYPQQPMALNHLTALEALVLTGQFRGLTAPQARVEALDLLDHFGLQSHRHKVLKGLSGGEQRLVGIGTALIGRLPILVLDEPTNELDPRNRRLVWDLLRHRNEREGTTIIVVTHNVHEAELVVDRVAVIDRGRLLALDSVSNLKQRVDQRLRLEATVASGSQPQAISFLQAWGAVQTISDTRLRITLDRAIVGRVIDAVVEQAAHCGIVEYRLIPPTLEDAYFHLGGQEVSVS